METQPHIFFILDTATASTSGRREYMEDRHTSTQLLARGNEAYYYGVYDGHCGDNTAEYLKQNMHKILERQPDFRTRFCTLSLLSFVLSAERTPYVAP